MEKKVIITRQTILCKISHFYDNKISNLNKINLNVFYVFAITIYKANIQKT